jgi:SHS2 domain-containing protein
MTAGPDYEFVEGATSDISFVARGETLEGAFAAAAEALLAATLDDPGTVEERERRRVAFDEPDLELLLLRFLNELVYLRDAEQLLLRARRLRVERNDRARLDAELWGEPIHPERHPLTTEVKAATAHALRVRATADGWEVSVTLDV